ncbi:MAG: hypothetical protein JXJ19_09895 [Elusimicrobia bacterium]|nr:hypothetical protein [Elusimicrobiota bacterium]
MKKLIIVGVIALLLVNNPLSAKKPDDHVNDYIPSGSGAGAWSGPQIITQGVQLREYDYKNGVLIGMIDYQHNTYTYYDGGQPQKVVWLDDKDTVILEYVYEDGELAYTVDQYQNKTYFETIGGENKAVRVTWMYDGGVEVTAVEYVYSDDGTKLLKTVEYDLPEGSAAPSKTTGYDVLSETYYDSNGRIEKTVYMKTETKPEGLPGDGWEPSFKKGDVRYYHYDGNVVSHITDQNGKTVSKNYYSATLQLVKTESWNKDNEKFTTFMDEHGRPDYGIDHKGKRTDWIYDGAYLVKILYPENEEIHKSGSESHTETIMTEDGPVTYSYTVSWSYDVTWSGENSDEYNKYGRCQNRNRQEAHVEQHQSVSSPVIIACPPGYGEPMSWDELGAMDGGAELQQHYIDYCNGDVEKAKELFTMIQECSFPDPDDPEFEANWPGLDVDQQMAFIQEYMAAVHPEVDLDSEDYAAAMEAINSAANDAAKQAAVNALLQLLLDNGIDVVGDFTMANDYIADMKYTIDNPPDIGDADAGVWDDPSAVGDSSMLPDPVANGDMPEDPFATETELTAEQQDEFLKGRDWDNLTLEAQLFFVEHFGKAAVANFNGALYDLMTYGRTFYDGYPDSMGEVFTSLLAQGYSSSMAAQEAARWAMDMSDTAYGHDRYTGVGGRALDEEIDPDDLPEPE